MLIDYINNYANNTFNILDYLDWVDAYSQDCDYRNHIGSSNMIVKIDNVVLNEEKNYLSKEFLTLSFVSLLSILYCFRSIINNRKLNEKVGFFAIHGRQKKYQNMVSYIKYYNIYSILTSLLVSYVFTSWMINYKEEHFKLNTINGCIHGIAILIFYFFPFVYNRKKDRFVDVSRFHD